MEDVIENSKRKDEKIYITFYRFPKEFRKEEQIMNLVRNLNYEHTEKFTIHNDRLEIHNPSLNKLTLSSLNHNFLYRRIFELVYKKISERMIIREVSLDDWYIKDEENIILYRYKSFEHTKIYCNSRWYQGKIVHFCLDKRCNGELEIDFESFWKNNTSKYLCVYKCNKCGKFINAVDLIEYMNQHEE